MHVLLALLSLLTCDTGTVERGDYYAPSIETRMYYSVYLPPCYDQTGTDYPVVYLMHGSNDDDRQWLRLGLAELQPPMIVVMPFGNWIANENRFGYASWDQVFIDELMPLVESTYRVDSERRSIGGISRGGFWAFHLAFRYPELFDAVGGHSAFFDLYHAPDEYNPLDLALNAPGIESLRIMLDRGVDDFAAPGLDIMHERLDQRGLDHSYTIHPEGQHNNDYWREHMAEYLVFYTEQSPEPSIFVTATPRSTTGLYMVLPVVAFPSLESDISSERLQAVLAGESDSKLVVAEDVAELLAEQGITLAESVRRVAPDAVSGLLARDRSLFTLLPFDRLTPTYRVLTVDGLHPLDMQAYPLVFNSITPNYDPQKLTRLMLSGVTALTRNTITALDENGVDWATDAIAPYVEHVDFFHTSNEVSFYTPCPDANAPRLGDFCSKPEHFDLFTVLDVDIVELSGNHNNDYGYDAYRETLTWFVEQGIATIGGGETLADARQPLILEHKGNSIAMLGCNWIGPYYALVNEDAMLAGGVRPGAAFCDRAWLRETVPQLAAAHDVVVVTIQYAEFDQYTPTPEQRGDFLSLADLGANVVVGTQAHFPQTFEFTTGMDGSTRFIHYGLGNLYFDQRFFAGVRFFMDELFIYDGQLLTVGLFTGIIEDQGRPRPMTADERRNFLFLMFNEYGDN